MLTARIRGLAQKHIFNPMPTMFCISLNFVQINANMRPTEYMNKKIAALQRGRYAYHEFDVFAPFSIKLPHFEFTI